jgi:hypothetical protein
MTTAPDVAVVATQLAQTDRRALSQAWYSALHLAHDDAPPRAHVGTAATEPAVRRTPARSAAAAPAAPDRAHAAAAPRTARTRAAAPAPPDRRSAATEVSRRVERAVATIARAPQPQPCRTLAIDGGRVTLLVRSDAHATRIVALCSEPLRPTVERALAHARFALAARGATVDAR